MSGIVYNPYPMYTESGVDWLGEIPAHWEVQRLKHLGSMQAGSAITSEQIEPIGDYPVFGGNGIRGFSDGYTHDGSFPLIGRQGALCGCVTLAFGRFWASEHAIVFRPRMQADPNWMAAVLLAMDLNQYSVSAAQPGLAVDNIGVLQAAVPTIAEQHAIIAFLDRETARIDALVAKKERLIALLQERRTALITRAVTKGLDPAVPMKDSSVKWMGDIPAHWDVTRLRRELNWIEQGWSPECENRVAEENEWGVLKAGCVNRGEFIESEHKALPASHSAIPDLEIREGDLLMSRASGSRELVGSVAVVPACRSRLLLCDKIFRLHVNEVRVNTNFVAYALSSRMARSQIEGVLSGGSGLANNIAQGVVKDLTLALPPRMEQQLIANFLDAITASVNSQIGRIREAITGLYELRAALISAAVTGKIDVRDQYVTPDASDAAG